MAWTQDDLDALEDLIKTGASSITYSNGTSMRTIVQRPLPDMLQLRDMMRRDLGLSEAKSFDDRARKAATKKGID
jgi:hypothetical protein